MRRLAIAVNDQRVVRVEMSVCADVAFYLQNKKRQQIADLESRTGKQLLVRVDAALGLDEMRLNLFDGRDGIVVIDQLSAVLAPQPHVTQLGSRPGAPRRNGGRFEQRRDAGPPPRRLPPPPPRQRHEDDFDEPDREDEEPDFDQHEDAVESSREHDDRSPRDPSEVDEAREFDTEAASEAADDVTEPRGETDERDARGQMPRDGVAREGGDNGEDGTRRRRRRRRGRRGRGRGGNRDGAGFEGASDDRAPTVSSDSGEASFDQPEEAIIDSDEQPAVLGENRDASAERFDDERDLEDSDRAPTASRVEPEEDMFAGPPEPGNEKFPVPSRAVGKDDGADKRRRRRGGRGRRRNEKPAAPKLEGLPQDEPEIEADLKPLPRAPREPAPVTRQPTKAPVVIPRTGSTDRHLNEDEPILPQPLSRPRSYNDLDSIPDDLDDR